jgi:hypothetical protein
MKLLAKSWMQHLLVMVATSTSLFAQSSWPEKLQNQASALDARQIVVQSLADTERSWQARDHYTEAFSPLRAGWDCSSSETILVAGLSGRKPLSDFGCPV